MFVLCPDPWVEFSKLYLLVLKKDNFIFVTSTEGCAGKFSINSMIFRFFLLSFIQTFSHSRKTELSTLFKGGGLTSRMFC